MGAQGRAHAHTPRMHSICMGTHVHTCTPTRTHARTHTGTRPNSPLLTWGHTARSRVCGSAVPKAAEALRLVAYLWPDPTGGSLIPQPVKNWKHTWPEEGPPGQ